MISTTGVSQVGIASLSGFELTLAPTFREDFRESLHRMVAVLTALGATEVMVFELEDRYSDLRFSPYGASFLTDAIIVMRYVELEGDLNRMLAVVKVRNSKHSHAFGIYDITDQGIVIGPPQPEIEALLAGHPRPAAAFPKSSNSESP